MKEKILKLLEQAISGEWEERSEAIATLMTMSDPSSVKYFHEVMDPASELHCIYFNQFLGKTLFVEGFVYLIPFLSDTRDRVQQEAILTFDRYLQSQKIDEKQKVSLLINTLKNAQEKGKIYAAESLGKYHKREGVIYLIEALHDLSEKVRLACVDSLREIGDINAAFYLSNTLTDPYFHIRYAACFALGEFGISGFWKQMIPLLRDPKASVRQAATWSIARLAKHKAIPYLIQQLNEDPTPLVRVEAVKRLGKIASDKVVYPLLKASIEDQDQNVKSAANYGLDNIPNHIKYKIYLRCLRSKDLLLKQAALLKISKNKSKKTFSIIKTIFLNSSENPQIQATCAECFGNIGDPKAIPLLLLAIRGNPLVTYSAICSLASLMGDEHKGLTLNLLKDAQVGEINKQIILQYILKKIHDRKLYLNQPLIDLLVERLSSKNINVAYLSVRILGESLHFSTILPMLQAASQATDKEFVRKTYETVQLMLGGNVVPLLKLLFQPFVDNHMRENIFKCLEDFQCDDRYRFLSLIGSMQLYSLIDKNFRIQLFSLISKVVGNFPELILKALSYTHWPDDLLKELLYILDEKITPQNYSNTLFNIHSLQHILDHSDPEIKTLTIRCLEKIGQTSSIPKLMTIYFSEAGLTKNYTRSAIRSLVTGGHQ